jgi:exodeoxyribonuclease VII small subunit
MKNDLRVSMPEEIMLRMAQADTPDAARKEGVKIAQEMLEAVRPLVQGVQVSAPFGRYTVAAEVIASVCPNLKPLDGVIPMPSFEESLKKLETIVDQLEKGDLALEESLKLFEEGVGSLCRLQAGTGRRRRQSADAGQAARRAPA